MAIEAGRVGVRADQVDPYGRVKGGGGGTDPAVTKLQTQVGSYSFRTNPEDGSAQYRKSDEDEWENFSSGGGADPVLLWENPTPENALDGSVSIPSFANYNAFIVYSRYSSGDTASHNYGIMFKGEEGCMVVRRSTFYGNAAHRIYTIDDSGFTTNNAYFGSSANMGACIPEKIYGINLTI